MFINCTHFELSLDKNYDKQIEMFSAIVLFYRPITTTAVRKDVCLPFNENFTSDKDLQKSYCTFLWAVK